VRNLYNTLKIPYLEAGVTITTLAFSAVTVLIPAGQSMKLGVVDLSPFSKIRVPADERPGSPTNVSIALTITEGNGLVAELDVLRLTAPTSSSGSMVTNLYDVPGTKLTIFVLLQAQVQMLLMYTYGGLKYDF
jgi:hypothetical protein